MTTGCRGAVVSAGALLATLAAPVVVWLLRTPPYEHVDCGTAGPAAVRAAWLAGYGTAAFATAVACAAIGLWADARMRDQRRPDGLVVLATGLALAGGGWWWAEGECSPIALWVLVGTVGLLPAAFYMPLHLARLARAVHRADAVTALRSVRAVSCWGVLIVLPAFVGVVGGWGVDVYC